jgi:hypothetical protein
MKYIFILNLIGDLTVHNILYKIGQIYRSFDFSRSKIYILSETEEVLFYTAWCELSAEANFSL